MEPQRNESARPESTPERKKKEKRYQIVKLEERIAPNQGGTPHFTHNTKSNRCYA
jgi:hypothetical protein